MPEVRGGLRRQSRSRNYRPNPQHEISMNLSGHESFEIIPKTHKLWKFLPLRMSALFPLNIDNLQIAVLIDNINKIIYYHVVYQNNGNPDKIYLTNLSDFNLSLNCGIFPIAISPGSIMSMSGFSKFGHEG